MGQLIAHLPFSLYSMVVTSVTQLLCARNSAKSYAYITLFNLHKNLIKNCHPILQMRKPRRRDLSYVSSQGVLGAEAKCSLRGAVQCAISPPTLWECWLGFPLEVKNWERRTRRGAGDTNSPHSETEFWGLNMISGGVPRRHYQYAFTESRRFHYAQFHLSIMDFKWIYYFAQFW